MKRGEFIMKIREGMLITPAGYIAENIRGKTREAALKKIEELRGRIKQLRDAVEGEERSDEWKWRPHASVRISAYYDFIEAAKDYFKTQGWEYEDTEEDIREKEFNDMVERIRYIDFDLLNPGILLDDVRRRIDFGGEYVVVVIYYPYYPSGGIEYGRDTLKNMTKSEILEELRDIRIGRWKPEYFCFDESERLTDWALTITFTDGTEKKIIGDSCFPYNFRIFTDLLDITLFEY
jgi:hypothetical protein